MPSHSKVYYDYSERRPDDYQLGYAARATEEDIEKYKEDIADASKLFTPDELKRNRRRVKKLLMTLVHVGYSVAFFYMLSQVIMLKDEDRPNAKTNTKIAGFVIAAIIIVNMIVGVLEFENYW